MSGMTALRKRAPEAVYELIDLLRLAKGAVNRAQGQLEGDALALASRLSRQLEYLHGVSELLEHEATRHGANAGVAPHFAATAAPMKRLARA